MLKSCQFFIMLMHVTNMVGMSCLICKCWICCVLCKSCGTQSGKRVALFYFILTHRRVTNLTFCNNEVHPIHHGVISDGRKRMILKWRQNEHDGVSNHRRLDCLHSRLFRRRSKKTSKLCVTGFCDGNSPVTSEFPPQRSSNEENVSIWWHHHG